MDSLIRCKFFDDDGTPFGDGCRFGSKCRYIHPTDPVWHSATMPHRGRRNSDRFKDDRQGLSRHVDSGWSGRPSRDQSGNSSAQHDGESSSSRGGRGKGRARSHGSSGSWSKASGDFSSWDAIGSPSTSKSVENRTPTQGTWGAADTSGDASTKDSISGSGWSSSGWGENPWQTGKTTSGWSENPWQDGNTTSAWGGAPAGLWDGGGWGEDTAQKSNIAKANEPKPASSNQPAPGSPSILSKAPAILRLPKASDQAEALFKRPLPLKVASDSPAVPAIPTDVEMKEATVLATPSASTPTATKRARLPLPTRIKTLTSFTAPIRDSPTDTKQLLPPSPAVSQDWTRIPLSGSITGRVQQDDVSSDASGPIAALVNLDPKELHSRLVKEMIQAVITRYELLRAEERKDAWRKTRQSGCYQHSTPAAQKILDRTNQKYTEEITRLNKTLNSSLKRVVQYSDGLNAHRDLLQKGVDKKTIRMYTDELRDWVVDLDLSKRVSIAAAMIDQEKTEREAIKQEEKEKVTTLKNSVNELELQVTDIFDDLLHIQNTQSEDFQTQSLATERVLEQETPDNMPELEKILGVGGDAFTKLEERLKAMDKKTLDHLLKIADLKVYARELEEEVANLKQKDQEIAEFRKEAAAKLDQMEIWKTEDKARLNRLSKKVEDLNQYPHPLPQTNNPPTIKIDDLAPFVNELITEYIAREIQPALDAIAAAVEVDGRHFTAEFNKMVEEVVMKTYELVQMAFKAQGLVPQLGVTS